MRRVTGLLVLAFTLLGTGAAFATVDVAVPWERATLEASFGPTHQRATVVAVTEERAGALYLKSLLVTVGNVKLVCPRHLFSDLSYPQVSTLHITHSGELVALDPHGEFSLRFSFGEAPVGARYREVRLQFKNGRLAGREFAVPTEDGGTQYQSRP